MDLWWMDPWCSGWARGVVDGPVVKWMCRGGVDGPVVVDGPAVV